MKFADSFVCQQPQRERERERGQLYKVFIGADKDSGVNYLFTDLMDINLFFKNKCITDVTCFMDKKEHLIPSLQFSGATKFR